MVSTSKAFSTRGIEEEEEENEQTGKEQEDEDSQEEQENEDEYSSNFVANFLKSVSSVLFHVLISKGAMDLHYLMLPQGEEKNFPILKLNESIFIEVFEFFTKEKFDWEIVRHENNRYSIQRIWDGFAIKYSLEASDFLIFHKYGDPILLSSQRTRFLVDIVKANFIKHIKKAPVGMVPLESFVPKKKVTCVFCEKAGIRQFFVCKECKKIQHRTCNNKAIDQKKCNYCMGPTTRTKILKDDKLSCKLYRDKQTGKASKPYHRQTKSNKSTDVPKRSYNKTIRQSDFHQQSSKREPDKKRPREISDRQSDFRDQKRARKSDRQSDFRQQSSTDKKRSKETSGKQSDYLHSESHKRESDKKTPSQTSGKQSDHRQPKSIKGVSDKKRLGETSGKQSDFHLIESSQRVSNKKTPQEASRKQSNFHLPVSSKKMSDTKRPRGTRENQTPSVMDMWEMMQRLESLLQAILENTEEILELLSVINKFLFDKTNIKFVFGFMLRVVFYDLM